MRSNQKEEGVLPLPRHPKEPTDSHNPAKEFARGAGLDQRRHGDEAVTNWRRSAAAARSMRRQTNFPAEDTEGQDFLIGYKGLYDMFPIGKFYFLFMPERQLVPDRE
jgi:hypothetical protein